MRCFLLPCFAVTSILLQPLFAHEGHEHQQPMADPDHPAGAWAANHMASEHHMSGFDLHSFFTLHDFDSSGSWEEHEIYRMYGFEHESTAHIPDHDKDEAVQKVLEMYDGLDAQAISYDAWFLKGHDGVQLPDFGWGPGHHGDSELEYELHHFERYHGEDAHEEDLTHPEDIAHFKQHDEEHHEAELMAEFDKQTVVEENIPAKFRRNP